METTIDWTRTGLLLVDPQHDVLHPSGALWNLVGEQVTKLDIPGKLRALRDAAESAGVPVFYASVSVTEEEYATWPARNGLHKAMASTKAMVPGKGGRFAEGLEPTDKTIILVPRKGPSPAASDINIQLRQRRIEGVVVAGMVANLCVESHVRELTDAGFDAIVASDAIATTDDVSLSATLANFGLLATGLLSSAELLASLASYRVQSANPRDVTDSLRA